MDTQRHGGGRSIAKTSTIMGLGQQSTELPVVPHGLRNIFQATVTVEIQPWTGELLSNGCSDAAFKKYIAALNNNIKPITDFMDKFPKPGVVFMQAFASGEICFSDEQVTQSTLLFEELKRSKKVAVKAEPINQESASVSVETSSSARDVRPASSSVQADGPDEESKDVELVLSFDNETQMKLASMYATSVHRAIRCFGVMAILRTVRPDFKTAAYPDGLHSHILQYMPDDPAHALKLIFALKFQSKESSIVENVIILSNLKTKQGFCAVFNKFRDCHKQLSVLEPKLDLSILTLFLMCAVETGWTSRHGSPSEKAQILSELNKKREDAHLSISVLQEFFEALEALSPQDKLKADQPAPPNDFAGAVTGRGAGGKGGKGGQGGKGGTSRRRLPLQLSEVPVQSDQTPKMDAENQDKRVRPARVQQAQPREVCRKYFTGECDMQNCRSFHLFPCLFFYQKGKKCVKPVHKCGFSHEFDAAGLQNHARLHKLDPTKFKLPAPPPSAGSEQIIQPILRAVDCRDCGQTHVPGKCKQKRPSFSGLVRVDRGSAGADIGRYDALIRNESAEHSD